MRGRLTSLTERETAGGHRYMTGRLGGCDIRLHLIGQTSSGANTWELTILTANSAKTAGAERNQRGATWRIARRKEEGVERLGGND